MACRIAYTLLVVLFCISTSCAERKKDHLISGETMGTTYHIKVVAPRGADVTALKAQIDLKLEQLNQSMSTYRPDSEISRFNRSRRVASPFPVSADFFEVMVVAAELYHLTGGAWDGTVKPLVNLWGFGSSEGVDRIPAPETIMRIRDRTGFRHIDLSKPGALKKRRPDIAVDLASIAKGYGVDVVARLIRQMGFDNFLVEIGGEVYASGRRPDGRQWRVGINQPDKTAPVDKVYKALPLENQAMATSGDYRNYIEIEGQTFSHIIDPRSGYPVNNGVVSVSVVAASCTLADGLATALMVMGPEEGLALLDRLDNAEGLMIVRQPDGALLNFWTKGLHLQ